MNFFSEREQGELQRNIEDIEESVWEGIEALIQTRIADGSFGECFPEFCPDGNRIVGTEVGSFWKAVKSEIPKLKIPGFTSEQTDWGESQKVQPQNLDVLDFIEFCWRNVSKPIKGENHSFFNHHHLDFDKETGRSDFRERVNTIFRRNCLVYDLNEGNCSPRPFVWSEYYIVERCRCS